jgi:hypothetical protein
MRSLTAGTVEENYLLSPKAHYNFNGIPEII